MALPPLFGRAQASRATSIEDQKQEAFAKLKAICVPILQQGRAPQSSGNTRTLSSLLEQLRQSLEGIPSTVFTSALSNYVLFPLSSLLQPAADGGERGETTLEATMKALEVLVCKSRTSPVGLDARVLQELWIMSVLKLGGPLDSAGPKGKGKAKEVNLGEETKYAILKVLLALTKSVGELEVEEVQQEEEEHDDPLGEDIDWTADDPFEAASSKKKKSTTSTKPQDDALPALPPIPILFHTLTTLTSLGETPSSFQPLQLAAIEGLRILFERFLSQHPPSKSDLPPLPLSAPAVPTGPSPFVATALPGTASALSRVALSVPRTSTSPVAQQARRQASTAVVASLSLLGVIVRLAIADQRTNELRRSDATGEPAATLEELKEELTPEVTEESLNQDDSTTPADLIANETTTNASGPALPTPAWLSHTIANLTTLFLGLASLASHEAPQVRVAFVGLLEEVLSECSLTLGESKAPLLESLLLLSGDEWEDVNTPARSALAKLFSKDPNVQLAADVVKQRLIGLPAALQRSDEAKVCSSARVVVAALRLIPVPTSKSRLLSGIDRWSWSLLRALDFDRVVGADSAAKTGMAQAWITSGNLEEHSDVETPWPYLNMRHVKETSTKKELELMWQALGKWAAVNKQSGELVDQFLSVATGARAGEGVAVSALWVLDGLLNGMKEVEDNKSTKKVVRGVVRNVLELLESAENELPTETPPAEDAATPTDDSLVKAEGEVAVTVEHQRGVSLTPGLDSLKPVAITNTDLRSSYRILLACFSLRLLSSSAAILTSSFQQYLLQTLYHVLSFISPTAHPLVRLHAQLALSRISYWTSYASPQNLILANVDYVVNSVSQRLSISRLNPAAPLVLVEMIRLVGEPILPMVQDLVEDVFEALDDYHGYEELTVGLWGVLDALMRVMSRSLEKDDVATGNGRAAPSQPEQTWKTFQSWHSHRNDAKPEQDSEDFGTNPQTPFESGIPEDDKGAEFPPDQSTPATRTQIVGAQILSKALYFLSHSSPFLRSRVLSLMSSAIPLFTRSSSDPTERDVPDNRQSDLLPVIHRAWPYILNRLTDTEPYVAMEAAGLIESLATHVGDFMSRRILDDVWPRFRTILEKQDAQDQQSAIAGQSPYTISHRTYRSILNTMLQVGRGVPLKETILWEQAVLFRRFLDAKLDNELQRVARGLYKEFGKVNPDIVWLALSAAVEQVADDDLPYFLRMTLDLQANVELILDDLVV